MEIYNKLSAHYGQGKERKDVGISDCFSGRIKKMRRYFLFKVTFLIISTVVCIITLNSCSKITEYRELKKREEERQKQEQTAKETQKMLNEMSYRKEAILLAIKYKIEEDKVFNLLVETKAFSLESIQASLEGRPITKNRLNSLAEKYNIPTETLASILIDYYSMKTCEH